MKISIMGKKTPIIEADLNNLELDGFFDPSKNVIFINKDSDEKFLIIVHELMHGLFHRIGIDQTNISRDIQEILAESVANFIGESFNELQKIKYSHNKKSKNNSSRNKKK